MPEHGEIPDSNQDYWKPKLERNVERAEEKNQRLENRGWKVVRVWEHQIKYESPLKKIVKEIESELNNEPDIGS